MTLCGETVLLSRRVQANWLCLRPCSPLQVPAYTLGCAVSAIARSCELMVPQPQVPKFIYRTVCALEQLQAVQVCLRRTQHAQLRSRVLLEVADSLGRRCRRRSSLMLCSCTTGWTSAQLRAAQSRKLQLP